MQPSASGAASSAAQQAIANATANAQLRAALLQTGIRYKKNLGLFGPTALGQTTRVKLFNVGIITSLQIFVTLPITIGTAIAVPSLKAPWNLISKIRLTDYDGVDRIILSGYQLYMLNSVRNRQPFGWNNQPANATFEGFPTGLILNPSVPTAVGSATLSFWLDVPICLNDNRLDGLRQDLSGAIYAQTGVGDLYLSIDWNNSLYTNTAIESVYSGAPTTTVVANGVVGPSVQVYQKYIMPQPVGKNGTIPLPPNDLLTVYELNGNLRVTQNIAVNAETLINFPNVRKVLGCYTNFVNGTLAASLGTTDLSNLRILVNGNNTLEETLQNMQFLNQRLENSGDLNPGSYWWEFRDRPIETAIFGNVQLGLTPNAVNAGAYFEVGFESLYAKGSALPGLVQGS